MADEPVDGSGERERERHIVAGNSLTILLSADSERIGRRADTDDGAGQDPDAVGRPFLEILQEEFHGGRIAEEELDGFRIRAAGFHVVDDVVGDVAVLQVLRRRLPAQPDRCGILRFGADVFRSRSRN